MDVPNTTVSKRSKRLVLLDSKHQATNTSTRANYVDVAYDLLPYNMESATLAIESNSK